MSDPLIGRVARRCKAEVSSSRRTGHHHGGELLQRWRRLRRRRGASAPAALRRRNQAEVSGAAQRFSEHVAWEGVGSDGEVVTGVLELHAAVATNRVVSWAEIVADAPRISRSGRAISS